MRLSRTSGGDPGDHFGLFQLDSVFPARAGVILPQEYSLLDGMGLSRTSGGDPTGRLIAATVETSFPHERG